MKLHAWLTSALASLTAVSVLAQAPNTLPPIVPPPAAPTAAPAAAPAPDTTTSTNKPAAKSKTKHTKAKSKTKTKPKAAAKKKTEAASTNAPALKNGVIVLNPPASATVKCNVLDVRGQGSFTGEIITYLKKGEPVTVLEEITLAHTKAGEPKQWSKIVMPANTAVWVDGDFINGDSMTVKAEKLNVRGGPGENYSVVGRLAKGDAVKEIGKKQNWVEIASPANAYAFVASEFLGAASEAPAVASNPAPAPAPEPAPTPAPVPPAPAPVVVNVPPDNAPPAPATVPPPAPAPSATGLTAPAPTAASQSDQELAALHRSTPNEPAITTPVPTAGSEPGKEDAPRIVTREGTIHHSYNIQAPSPYEIHDIKTGVLTEYLQPAPTDKAFNKLVGKRARVTGSEFYDPNWPRTPILHVETADSMR
jgi:SH3-like domain-containing protein